MKTALEAAPHRALALVAALFSAVVLLPFVAMWICIAPTGSGWFYIAGLLLTWVGLLTSPWRVRRLRGVFRCGLVLLAITALFRISTTGETGTGAQMLRQGEPCAVARYGNRLAAERDALIVGASLALVGPAYESARGPFQQAMRTEFEEMRSQQGTVPTPWFATYIGQQSSDSFDMQVFDVAGADTAVVFLHGFGGNFTLFCWEVAQAAARSNVATLCPSTGWLGQWWLEDARKTIRIAMQAARARGYRRIFLAGLSNGGIGLGRHADEFRDDVAGFIFISGVGHDAKSVRRPVLVVHGERDPNVPAEIARKYAKRSIHAKYVGIDGGHYVLVEDRDAVRDPIADWLAHHTRRRMP